MKAPRIAWPTLLLFVAVCAAWAAGASGVLPTAAAIALSTLAAYAAFTPVHEAAHRSIGRSKALNEVIGRLASLLLLGPFVAVRRFHLEHHRHTNDAGLDPDHWSGRGPSWLLPLRWATQDLHYYFRFLEDPSAFPRAERVELALTAALFAALAAGAIATGHGGALLLHWVLPARLAITLLACLFDWLPHRPHRITAEQDRYRATSARPGRLLDVLLIGQNLHLLHHLYPGVPFYRYRLLWTEGLGEPPPAAQSNIPCR